MNFLKNIKDQLLLKAFFFTKFKNKIKGDTKNLILIEFNEMLDCYIPYAYLTSQLSKKFNAKILAFSNIKEKNFINFTRYFLMLLNPLSKFSIYKSFGVGKLIYFILNDKKTKQKIDSKFKTILKKNKNKKYFEKLKINNILVGDLFYDSYLKKFKKSTIELESEIFKRFLYEEISKFYFWYNFIDKNVKSIIVSHTVYTLAVPMRICVNLNIDAFQITWKQIHRLNKKNFMAYNEFKQFPKLFKKLPSIEKKRGIQKAKKQLKKRLNGIVGVDMPYSTKTAYGKIDLKNRLLKRNKKLKVLITTHCFFDSPHSYGYNIFPDFYEWIDFLGRMTGKTNFDWYIKTHPDYLTGTLEIIKNFIKKYPKFHLLPAQSSHNQLVKEGIDVVLTVYGTIGCEYPLFFNKPVINASLNNPHIGYKFNYHSKSIKDYEKKIKNLPYLIKNFSINQKEVYEYYYMQHLYKYKNIFYSNLMKFKNKKEKYSYLVKCAQRINDNKILEKEIINQIKIFIDGKNYFSNL